MAISMKELAELGYITDPDPENATILFQMWKDKGVQPDELEEGYYDMKPFYIRWLKATGNYPLRT